MRHYKNVSYQSINGRGIEMMFKQLTTSWTFKGIFMKFIKLTQCILTRYTWCIQIMFNICSKNVEGASEKCLRCIQKIRKHVRKNSEESAPSNALSAHPR